MMTVLIMTYFRISGNKPITIKSTTMTMTSTCVSIMTITTTVTLSTLNSNPYQHHEITTVNNMVAIAVMTTSIVSFITAITIKITANVTGMADSGPVVSDIKDQEQSACQEE
jgi:hypothetical protein